MSVVVSTENYEIALASGKRLEKYFTACDSHRDGAARGAYAVVDAECVEVCVCSKMEYAEMIAEALDQFVKEPS